MRISSPISTELEVRDFRLVIALCSAGTTAKAAQALHLAQPSVSRALLSLEERLGTRLFDRRPHGLVATEAGARLASEAAEMLSSIRDLERRVRAPKEVAQVRLVCECYTAYHWLPAALSSLESELPGVSLSLRIEHTKSPLAALEAGDIDAALITSSYKSNDTFRSSKLFADELVFVVGSTHPLAAKKHLSPSDVEQHRLFTAPPTPHEVRAFMSWVFGRARPRLSVSPVPLTEPIVELARAGMGIGLLTEWVVKPYLKRTGIVAKRLSKGPLRRAWQLVWRRSLGAAGPKLLRALKASNP